MKGDEDSEYWNAHLEVSTMDPDEWDYDNVVHFDFDDIPEEPDSGNHDRKDQTVSETEVDSGMVNEHGVTVKHTGTNTENNVNIKTTIFYLKYICG